MREDSTAWTGRDLAAIRAEQRAAVDALAAALDPDDLARTTLTGASVAETLDRFRGLGDTDPERTVAEGVQLEQDVRTAVERPGSRDGDAVRVALDVFADDLSDRIVAAGLPPLRVTVEQWGTIAGSGAASRCVVADRFDLVRSLGGRRSVGQVTRFSWGTDPGPYLEIWTPAGRPPETDAWERDPRIPDHMVEFDITGVRRDEAERAPQPKRLPRIVRGG